MVVHRHIFFLALFLIPITILVTPRVTWLMHSKKTNGIFYFEGKGNALEQFRESYSIIYFKLGKDTVWFNGPGGLRLKEDAIVPVLYQTGNPADAKVDSFRTIWGGIVIYGGLPLLVLLVIALHPEIVPYHAKLRLTCKKPYIQILDNRTDIA